MIAEDKLRKIVGAGSINREQATLVEYSRDMSFVNAVKPGCIVKPGNMADIEAIVKLANETLTPLVPVSSGPPHFRGDTVPGIGGAAIIDLSGMKKIIKVDRTNRVAMFEPGITFDELIPAVAREGLRLNMPLLPRWSKSVTGSLLEREPVIMPKYHWDIGDPLACVEVISAPVICSGQERPPGRVRWKSSGPPEAPRRKRRAHRPFRCTGLFREPRERWVS